MSATHHEDTTPGRSTVDRAIDLAAANLTRRFAAVYTFVIWTVLPLTFLEGFELDLSLPTRLGLALALTVVNLGTLMVPWDQWAGTPRGRRTLEAFPLVHTTVFAAAYVGLTPAPVFPLGGIAFAVLGAAHARPPAVIGLAGIPMLALVARVGDAPTGALETAVLIAITAICSWVTFLTGRAQRRLVQATHDAQLQAEHNAEQLAVVAGAARELQDLEPNRVLQALVDATADLGWDAAGLYAPSSRVEGHVFAATRNLPMEVVDGVQPAVGLFGVVLRTGEPVAWEDYAAMPDANPVYQGITASAAGAPILVHGVQKGALVTSASRRRSITQEDLDALELLALLAGRALELAEEFALQQQTVEELERINALKQDFLATVSHELRTPLSVVLGMAETMDRRWDAMDEGVRRAMTNRMYGQAVGLEQIIEALLDFSRLERGIVQPRRGDVALLDLVEGVLDRLGPVTEAHDVRVAEGPHSGRGEAWADPVLIERVVENLVVNACRHTPPGTSVRIFVRHEGPNAVVEVADDGPGIPAEDLDRIVQRFERGGDPDTRSEKGLGLGLAFCREVLAMHDSELEITSKLGTGSTFSFALARGRTGERREDARRGGGVVSP